MNVGDLAREVGVSAGRVLDACESLGIDADGRTSVLSEAEVSVLRDALAGRGTRREAAADGGEDTVGGGTRREAGTGPGRTRREGSSGRTSWEIQLPAVLAERFELVRLLHHGGEGFVMLARDLASGDEVVLKGYYAGLAVDASSLEILSRPDIDLDHVVRVHDYGTLPDGGFYEVQEYCTFGSLRELMGTGASIDLDRLISELTASVSYVHGLGILHRDLKPENILARSVDPLDLVVADFGLVRQLAGSVRRTTRAGTVEYSPPEGVATNVDVSQAWDWWAVGIIVAEVATGVHPLALPDGSFPSADDIRSELAQRPVSLDGIDDERVRLLCAGLLVRDRRQRWGADEVARWHAGESPTVTDDTPGLPRASTVTVLFGGREHRTTTELAGSLQGRWTEAMSLLFQDPDPSLVEETTALCRASGNQQAVDLLSEKPKGEDVIRHLARLLAELDPNLTPEFDGVSVTPAGLERAATAVLEQSDTTTADTLQAIERGQVLRIWRRLPGMDDAVAISERWKDLRTQVDPLVPAPIKKHKETLQRLRACTLLAAIDPRHTADLRARTHHDDDIAREAPWWAGLADQPTDAAALVAYATKPHAHAEGAEQREQRRQKEEQERERERAEAERKQAQAAADRQQLIARRRTADRGVIKVVVITAALGFPAGLYRLNQQTEGFSAPMDSLAALFEADAGPMILAAIAGGAFIGPAIGVAILLWRRNWDTRPFGLGLAVALGVIALVAYAIGGNVVEDAAAGARSTMRTTPIPESRFDACDSSSVWTGTVEPTRTFIDDDCRTVVSYDGWLEQWSFRAGGQLGGLVSMDGNYIVLSQDQVFITALDAFDGSRLWTESCPSGYELDESQFDQGEDTPDQQRLTGTCGGFPFDVDPSTGRP